MIRRRPAVTELLVEPAPPSVDEVRAHAFDAAIAEFARPRLTTEAILDVYLGRVLAVS